MIENTSDRDPLLHLAGSFGDSDRYITEMESAGQRQLVNSTMLPTEVTHGDLAEWGFVLGPVDPADSMFREVTLPEGWKKIGSDHAMWSYIHDGLGRERVSIFYKAAWYDRSAHCAVVTPHGYAYKLLYSDEQMVLDDTWATREAMTTAFQKLREHEVEYLPYAHSEERKKDRHARIAKCDRFLAALAEVTS